MGLIFKHFTHSEIHKHTKLAAKQEGFLQCQTPTSTIRLKDEGGRMEREGMKDGE